MNKRPLIPAVGLATAILMLSTSFTAGAAEPAALKLPKPHTLEATAARGTGEPPALALPQPHTLEATAARSTGEPPALALPQPHTLEATAARSTGEPPALALPKSHTLTAVAERKKETQPPESLDGDWDISWQKDEKSNGLLQLRLGANGLRGRYNAKDNGRLILQDAGERLDGYWIENSSDRECGSSRDGSRHWGRVLLKSGDNRNRFSGSWGYCDEAGPFSLSIRRRPTSHPQ